MNVIQNRAHDSHMSRTGCPGIIMACAPVTCMIITGPGGIGLSPGLWELRDPGIVVTWDRSSKRSQFRSTRRQRIWWAVRVGRDRRARIPCSARCKKRGVRSSQEYGVAELGADGPARHSSLLSPSCWTGPPPIPRCGPPRATNRITRSSRRSLPQEAARGFWIRAWGQREPALQGTGRLGSPAQCGVAAQGWIGHPGHLSLCELMLNRIPDPDVGAMRSVTRWASRYAASDPIVPPLSKGRRTWFINASNKTLATVPFPAGMIGRSLRPQIRVRHERSGVMTVCDQFRRPLGLSCSTADGPTPRWARQRSQNTESSITAARPSSSTDAGDAPTSTRLLRLTGRGSRDHPRGRIRPTRARNKTKNETTFARYWGNKTRRNMPVALLPE